MYFNIAFDVVTLLILLGIGVSGIIMSSQKVNSSGSYKVAVALLAIATTFDILAALTGGNIIWDSDELNVVFETIYMCCGMYCLYATSIAFSVRINYDYRKTNQIIFGMVTIYTFLLLVNIPTRILFDIVDGTYDNHILFYVAYAVPVFVMVYNIIMLAINRKNIETRIYVTMQCASIFSVLGVVIQVLYDRLILMQFGFGITLLVLNFVWETPDSQKLKDAVTELEESRKLEESRRQEIEGAESVKSRFLDGISDKMAQPIDEIEQLAEHILENNTDVQLREDAQEIINASKQFKQLLAEVYEKRI